MRKVFVFILFFVSLTALKAQVAGISTLSVLDMPASGRAAGVGFDYLSLYDDDVTLTLNNPSLISEECDNQIAVGLVNLFAGANFGTVAYSHNFKHLGAFTFSFFVFFSSFVMVMYHTVCLFPDFVVPARDASL